MSHISSPGIGSGLDVTSLVTQLVAAEGQPATQRLDRREAEVQARLTAYGTLKGAFSAFQTSLAALKDATTFQNKSAQSSDTAVATVSTTNAAVAGVFDLSVTQLAEAHSLATDTALSAAQFTSLGDVVGTGTLTFKFGTTDYDPSTDTYTSFVQNPDKAVETVTITDGSLSGIRDAINDADIGVTASTVFDGTNYRLVFTVEDTGAANSLEITVSDDDGDDSDGAGLSLFSFNATSNNMIQTQAAQDAMLSINGIDIQSAGNTLDKALEGLTINLLSTGSATLTVEKDASAISTNVSNFVAKFNALVSTINDLSSYDPATGSAGALNGDGILRSLDGQLRRILSNPVQGAADGFSILADIGITRSSDDGTLVLDNTRLDEVIKENPEAVTALFAAFGNPDDALVRFSASTDATLAGEYAINITQLASQGRLTGSAAANLTITSGSNDTLNISVDGVSASITLQAGTYTESALAAELQSRINASDALKDNDVAVTVSVSSGVLTVTSNRYGSASKVAVTGGNAATGLFGASPTATDGVDVAGTIGGFEATGSGQTLTGTNAATGLAIVVDGGALGDRGTVRFSRGYADEIDRFLSSVLGSDGILKSVTEGLNSRIERINDDRETLARRLESLEDRLRRQFTALDTLVSQLQATSDFLTNQLASLPVIGSRSSQKN